MILDCLSGFNGQVQGFSLQRSSLMTVRDDAAVDPEALRAVLTCPGGYSMFFTTVGAPRLFVAATAPEITLTSCDSKAVSRRKSGRRKARRRDGIDSKTGG
jgi:hypothetical protein